jgi:O-antigen ligase
MRILKYISLTLVLFNLPSFGLMAFGGGVGTALSYGTIFILFIYYVLEKKTTPNWWIMIIAILYFTISSLQFYGPPMIFMIELVKYFIFVLCGYEMTKHVSNTELFVFLLIGALSVGIEALLFTSDFGRYAGFYLNANVAGFICIYGYSVIFGIKNDTLKLLGQFVFTLMGLLTFSRTFIVIWLLVNIISLKVSIKNIRIFGIGFLIFATLLFIDQVVGLNNPRFDQLKSIANNEEVSSEEISEDSRTETWALFYDQIYEAPLMGSGYGTFSGKLNEMGVHNTYLMIIGEAGIIPFFLFLMYIGYLFFKSYTFFKEAPYLIMMNISLSVFLLANHNFFTFYYMTFSAMWIQYAIAKLDSEKENQINDKKILEV